MSKSKPSGASANRGELSKMVVARAVRSETDNEKLDLGVKGETESGDEWAEPFHLSQNQSHAEKPAGGHRNISRKGSSMSAQRIATVVPVAEEDANGRVADVYADIKRTKNIPFVPNLWRVLATNPDHLDLVWSSLKALMHPEAVGRQPKLDATTREIIALAVSATNGCSYCVNSHTAALRKLGLDTEALGEVLAIVGLFNTTNSIADGYQIEPDILPPLE